MEQLLLSHRVGVLILLQKQVTRCANALHILVQVRHTVVAPATFLSRERMAQEFVLFKMGK
jgi:hypothetical protein